MTPPDSPSPPPRAARGVFTCLLAVLGSFHIAIVTFALILIVTFAGTWLQKDYGLYDCQRWYFESWITPRAAWIWGWLPLPGMVLLLAVMFVNVLAGGIIRIRKSRRTLGVVISHFSMLGFIIAGGVSLWSKVEGYMTVYEGKRESIVQAHHDWVIEVRELPADGPDGAKAPGGKVDFIREKMFRDCTDGRTRTFFKSGWPFELKVSQYLRNARAVPASDPALGAGAPRAGDFALMELPVRPENERNAAGVAVEVHGGDGKACAAGIVVAAERHPFVFDCAGRRFSVHMDRERWEVPFHIHLDDFRATYYPGTRKAKEYESDIKVIHPGGRESTHRISMNQPLRDSGYVAFQTDFDHDSPPGEEKYSVFTVVKNTSDQWPLYSLLVCAGGLVFHFLYKLASFLKRSAPAP